MATMPVNDETTKLHKRRLMSKYDSVKVFVTLPGCPPRSYVLSRFLIARMLTVAKIPYTKSVKIALKLKKHFVDHDMLSISQTELEMALKEHMEAKGFGDVFFERMKLVHRFFSEKRPLVITICGVPSIGKSSFAQQLAARFNIANMLQTDMIYEVRCLSPWRRGSPFRSPTMFEVPEWTGRALTQAYERECHLMRRAIDAELQTSVSEGKALILEGLHLDPAFYLAEMMKFDAMTFPYCPAPLSQNRAAKRNISGAVRPIYIPIVVTCLKEDHWLQSHEALFRTGSRFFEPQSTLEGGEMIFQRIRELHDYLTECRHPNVAYVRVGLDGCTSALDELHDHFLKCISLAMEDEMRPNGEVCQASG